MLAFKQLKRCFEVQKLLNLCSNASRYHILSQFSTVTWQMSCTVLIHLEYISTFLCFPLIICSSCPIPPLISMTLRVVRWDELQYRYIHQKIVRPIHQYIKTSLDLLFWVQPVTALLMHTNILTWKAGGLWRHEFPYMVILWRHWPPTIRVRILNPKFHKPTLSQCFIVSYADWFIKHLARKFSLALDLDLKQMESFGSRLHIVTGHPQTSDLIQWFDPVIWSSDLIHWIKAKYFYDSVNSPINFLH